MKNLAWMIQMQQLHMLLFLCTLISPAINSSLSCSQQCMEQFFCNMFMTKKACYFNRKKELQKYSMKLCFVRAAGWKSNIIFYVTFVQQSKEKKEKFALNVIQWQGFVWLCMMSFFNNGLCSATETWLSNLLGKSTVFISVETQVTDVYYDWDPSLFSAGGTLWPCFKEYSGEPFPLGNQSGWVWSGQRLDAYEKQTQH